MYNSTFKKSDLLFVLIYLLLGFVLFVSYKYKLFNKEIFNIALIAFGFFCWIFLYIYYKKLRNIKIFTIWFSIGVIQYFVYKNNIGNTFFISENESLNNLQFLLCLPVMLLSFAFFRVIYYLMFKQELVVPIKYDLYLDGREVGSFDSFFTFIIYLSTILIPIFAF